jgi:Holliday junction resolvase RusA-like endonuclease
MISENFSNNLNEPPEYGELTMSFSLEPVSLQSKPQKKEFVKNEIRKSTRKLKYFLGGDVKVEIQWLVHEQERYERADSPDIDNIIKPILDGLSGPEGILIDDCQVQTIGSHWVDWTKKEHMINISIHYISEDFFPKKNLVFVNMGNNLFMPFHTNLPKEANILILEHLKKGIDLKDEILDKTGDYHIAKIFSSTQRVFHKSRISGTFKTMELEDFKSSLK